MPSKERGLAPQTTPEPEWKPPRFADPMDEPSGRSTNAKAPPLAIQRDPNTGRIARSGDAKREFEIEHPCRAPGVHKPGGPCPGYVVDHVIPLACGGADGPENMQWQTVEEAKAKDQWERHDCGK